MEDFGAFIKSKCLDFGVEVVKLYKHLCEDKKEFVLSKQLLRSGTSIGANLVEAQNGISHKDYLTQTEYDNINIKCQELNKIFNSMIKNSKSSN